MVSIVVVFEVVVIVVVFEELLPMEIWGVVVVLVVPFVVADVGIVCFTQVGHCSSGVCVVFVDAVGISGCS